MKNLILLLLVIFSLSSCGYCSMAKHYSRTHYEKPFWGTHRAYTSIEYIKHRPQRR